MRLPTFSREADTTNNTAPVRPRGDDPGDETTASLRPVPPPPPAPRSVSTTLDDTPAVPATDVPATGAPVATGPKPRASLLATLGLMLGVAGMLLVLSGPLMGYGLGVAGLALILSLSGIHATGRRHVAGKTDALLGTLLSLGALALGILALTGTLSWLGTDVQPVNSLREWLDAQFANRF